METKLKASFFNVFVQNINENKDNILFNTRSGKQLKISNDLMECLDRGTFEDIPTELQDTLFNMKILVPFDEDELEVIISQNKEEIRNSKTLYDVIMPSRNCQLGCYYCGQTHESGELSNDFNQKIVNRIKSKLIEGNYTRLEIGWFGGEPLMALVQLRAISKELILFCDSNNIYYSASMTTNGLSLKPNIYHELVVECRITSVEVTLDGPKEVHDQHRGLKSGKGSFEHIMRNLKSIFELKNFSDLNCALTIRCNIDTKNQYAFTPLLDELVKIGALGKIRYAYPAPIYSWGNDAHLISLEKTEFARRELFWFYELYKRGFFLNLTFGRKRQVCLSVNPDSDVYDANGDVWNCTETPYVESYLSSDYKIGNLGENVFSQKNVITNWNDELKSDKYWCNNCKILPICGGRCPKSWIDGIPACPSVKFNFEQRILGLYYLNNRNKFTAEDKSKFEDYHANNEFIQTLKELK
jgi:uncharacterized protein